MSDIIQLLPDNIANQIAAGEVIQRPASAVKELLENAVDAGADEIRLIVNDAGKQLIQVIDNGKGMSETDARMAFERHATSKIRNIDDLFHIKTMGFRGEALASIAAVAQVELKTRRAEDENGIRLEIENSVVVLQEPVAFEKGTSVAMKNLFFNVPARRNFLKSNASELKHIMEEFIRVAMAFPEVFFSLVSNGQEVFHLTKGTLKQRIVQVLGSSYGSKLVSVQEHTDYMNIYGFVGKPETAKKSRGDQYLFVNSRFIKSPYLNHAINQAFHELIPKDSFPMYALFVDLDPAEIDINVHPTKQEIKFEDEKVVYAFVQSAVKHALAQFSVTPTLDFELDAGIQQLDAVSKPLTESHQQAAQSTRLFQTFSKSNQAHFIERRSDLKNWESVYPEKRYSTPDTEAAIPPAATLYQETRAMVEQAMEVMQLHHTYVVVQTDQGFLVIHQQNAHERILYERYAKAVIGKPIVTQQSLFPATLELSPGDALLLQEILSELSSLGYQIESFGNNTFIVRGTPADVTQGDEQSAIEYLLEQYKHFSSELKFSKREKVLRTLAMQHAIKPGTALNKKAMHTLLEELFQCEQPSVSPNGKPVYQSFLNTELNRFFGR
ncbi:MAG TPA: DNA mismatch repair endonuclease MutL [Ferruginibacter sp.]|nr:DNA mismatch repair endonuclease MutL [Ferruginibacter sp.]HRO06511.1 DNA mismatch repair endonuclease MutL [Ferruginibacter sp.]HRO95464.1 DNA mismatch repair endonuclease MutL [Ferruginibacter sp.]HRP49950.1 DNA mismatch repair endonuclease MutL [Ferruginibacter sp.]